MANVKISALSKEYVKVPITALKSGVVADPTADTVVMAVLPVGVTPVSGDWIAATWETDTVNGVYYARVLTGPGTSIVLDAGTVYQPWVKVSDTPEVPVVISTNKLVAF
jgi:hypothetical protein